MTDRSCLVKTGVSVSMMMEMLLVFLGVVPFVASDYVNKIEGIVELPMANLHDSDSFNSDCQVPLSQNRMSCLQQYAMSSHWKCDVPYTFEHTETEGDSYREQFMKFVGSQTPCNKHQNGSYTCTIPYEHFRYEEVRLAFNVTPGSMVTSRISTAMPDELFPMEQRYKGPATEQIYRRRDVLYEPYVRFVLQCNYNLACLEDSVTVISLQYYCVH